MVLKRLFNLHEKHIKVFVQFIKFGLIGVVNTGIYLAVYYIFVFLSEKLYLIGNMAGFGISVLNAYYWNNKFVFKKTEKKTLRPLFKLYISYGSTFLLSTFLLYVMVDVLHVSAIVGPLVNLTITIPLNFIMNKYWAFK